MAVSNGIIFHSFRHWFSSILDYCGFSKTVRRDLLGHTPSDMTSDYTHSTIEMRRRAVSRLCQTSPQKIEDGVKVWHARIVKMRVKL